MRGDYYIIEHPTRGTLEEVRPDRVAGGRFAVSGTRSDCRRWPTLDAAKEARAAISRKVGQECAIRYYDPRKRTWEVVQ